MLAVSPIHLPGKRLAGHTSMSLLEKHSINYKRCILIPPSQVACPYPDTPQSPSWGLLQTPGCARISYPISASPLARGRGGA